MRQVLRFDENTHTYFLDEKPLISVTQLLKKHGLSPDYSFVNEGILKAAAVRGRIIHEEIERYVKHEEIGFTEELSAFIDLCKKHKLTALLSEVMVHNDIVAGTLDLLMKDLNEMVLADVKNTSSLNRESVSWQTSIYAYLYEKMHGVTIDKIACFHFSEKKRYIALDRVSNEEIERLFECERNNQIMPSQNAELATNLIQQIALLEQESKRIEDVKSALKKEITAAMKERNIKKFENEDIRLTYVAPTVRQSVDSKKLKEKYNDIYEECLSEKPVGEGVRVTVK